jgi:release factor glutamine methyltransferase
MSQEIEWLLGEKYKGEKSDAFFADCRRLALGEPLGFIIGHVPFLDCKIWLDSKPLIPRPETEYWTEKVISDIKTNYPVQHPEQTAGSDQLRILDICAGSGCIGVAIAKAIPDAIVDFSEIDETHLPTITKNLIENSINQTRTHLYHSNLFEAFSGTYQYIVSNPPYIDTTLRRIDASVVKNEPYVALFAGEGGMDVITHIIAEAPKHLERYGQLWLEHEPEQSVMIRNLAREYKFICTTHKDQYGVERYSVLVLQ